jgi:hypothetical protein
MQRHQPYLHEGDGCGSGHSAHHPCYRRDHLDRRRCLRDAGDLSDDVPYRGVAREGAPVPGRGAPVLIVIVGGTGFTLLSAKYGFSILSTQRGLGILIMLFAWTFYTVVILSEKKIFGKIFADPGKIDMDKALTMINVMHWVLLTVSFSAVAAGIWFAHGV